MKSIYLWFEEYSESHRNHTNEIIHWICIPLIMFSLLGLLWSIPAPYFASLLPGQVAPFGNWALVFALISLAFYVVLSIPIAIGMAFVTIIMLSVIFVLSNLGLPLWIVSLSIFILAWIGQFIGHKIEGKKPKFFQDIQFLLIGPAWLLSFIYKKLNINY